MKNYIKYFVGFFFIGLTLSVIYGVLSWLGNSLHPLMILLVPFWIIGLSSAFAETGVGAAIFSLFPGVLNGLFYGLLGLVLAATKGMKFWKRATYATLAYVSMQIAIYLLLIYTFKEFIQTMPLSP